MAKIKIVHWFAESLRGNLQNMPSTDKHYDAKRNPNQSRDEVHSTGREAAVRTLWLNPHVAEMCESRMRKCLCDCDCHIWQDENVQRELQNFANDFSHEGPPGLEDEEETETKTNAKVRAEEEETPTKGFLCCKKLSAKRSHSKQRREREQRKRRKSKENTTKKVHEKSRSRSHNRPLPANRRFKTREEAKRYGELKAIYTTRNPQQPALHRAKKCKERSSKKSAASSSTDSVSMAAQRQRKSRKTIARNERKTRPHVSNDSGYPRDRPNSFLYVEERESEVGCCGLRKKSKTDKQRREYEAYAPAHSTKTQTPRPNREMECALTSEEMKLLERLRATYTREVKIEQEKKSKRAPSSAKTTEEEAGCCGSSSKKKQLHSETDLYDQYKFCECSCGDSYPKEFERHQPTEGDSPQRITGTSESESKQSDKAPEQKMIETSAGSKDGYKQPSSKYPTRAKIYPAVEQKHAPRKTKSVETNTKHEKKFDKSKSDSSVYTSKRIPKSIKGAKYDTPEDNDSGKTSCCSFLCRKREKSEGNKIETNPKTKTKTNKTRKSPLPTVSFSPAKTQNRKRQASKHNEREKVSNVNVNRRKQPAFHPKPESKTRPAVKTSSSSMNRKPPPGDKRKAAAKDRIRPQTKSKEAKTSSKQPGKSSLKNNSSSEISCCPCLRAKSNFKDSNITEKGKNVGTENFLYHRNQ